MMPEQVPEGGLVEGVGVEVGLGVGAGGGEGLFMVTKVIFTRHVGTVTGLPVAMRPAWIGKK